MTIRRKAFTLIELLIVIVVIAILAAMMMLSSMEANSTAEAARVISDLNTIKRAALMYFADNPDTFLKAPFLTDLEKLVNVDDVMRYVDNGKDSLAYGADKANVRFECNKKEPIWYLHYQLPQYIMDNPRALEKLKLKARSHNLLCTGTFNYIPKEDEYYGGTRDSSKQNAMIYFRILP